MKRKGHLQCGVAGQSDVQLSVTSDCITVNTFSGVSATLTDSFTLTKNNITDKIN